MSMTILNRIAYILWIGLFKIVANIFFKIKFEGRENTPTNEQYIFAANHQNFSDGVLIALAKFPITTFTFIIAKRALTRLWIKSFVYSVDSAVADEGFGSLRALVKLKKRVGEGINAGIFPEGGISNKVIPGKFLPGVAKLSIDSKKKVVPVYINGTYDLRYLSYWFKRSELTIRFGKPIPLYEYAEEYNNNYDELASLIRDKVIELSGLSELIAVDKNVAAISATRSLSETKQVQKV